MTMHLLQVFTCHRCGEAFESLEEMQTHKLCHDTVLNSMKDGGNAATPPDGIARFSLGPQKPEQGNSMNKYDFISVKPTTSYATTTTTVEDTKPPMLKIPTAFYIPANMDNVSALSNKLVMEGMEKLAKENAEAQRLYEEEVMKLKADSNKFSKEQEQRIEEEKMKIAQAFTIKAGKIAASPSPSVDDNDSRSEASNDLVIVEGQETTHIVNGEGMSMFMLPSLLKHGRKAVAKEEESDMETEDSEQNSSKDSVGINREGDDAGSEGEGSERMDDSGISEMAGLENGSSKVSPRPEVYTKPCPKSKKPGFIAAGAGSLTENKTTMFNMLTTVSEPTPIAPKPMLSLINPKLNELIKAKVEQNMSQQQPVHSVPTFVVTNPSLISPMNSHLPKLTLIPNFSKITPPPNPMSSFASILPATSILQTQPNASQSSSATLAAVAASMSAQMTPKKMEGPPKLIKCEHCCIYFEDNAMSMLHNTLHSADTADPFTCRKCYKKLGNRLEFMAHLIWHLEPNMDLC